MKMIRLGLAAAAALLAATPASAALYSFTLSGGYNASWLMQSSPTPGHVDSYEFFMNDVAGEFEGLVYGPPELIFYSIEDEDYCTPFPFPGCHIVDRKGVQIFDFNAADPTIGFVPFSGYGDHFWTGPLSAPTFHLGTYALTGYGGPSATLVIAEVPSVPEPAAWAMMIAGFGAIGAAMRRRPERRAPAA